jgi:hypothetical protein
MQPYAVIDGPGEVYFDTGVRPNWSSTSMLVRAPAGEDVTGQLYFPRPDLNGMVKLKFRVPADWNLPNLRGPFRPRQAYARARQKHYQRLWKRGIPGAAWFRRQAMDDPPLGSTPDNSDRPFVGRSGSSYARMQQCYEMFSGGWAVSESLQLDQDLPLSGPNGALVDVATLRGIDVREFGWQSLIEGLHPAMDPLAAAIPADQHALFFPDLAAATRVWNQFRQYGGVVLRLAHSRTTVSNALVQYERQVGISFDSTNELLGRSLVQSVALTGSDPYYDMGTDVAILLETSAPEMLAAFLRTKVRLAAADVADVRATRGEVLGVSYHSISTPDRALSSHIAVLDRSVVLTNSLYQLRRLVSVRRGDVESLASLPEYTFFRDRYRIGERNESALLILSDNTIRRWCGPRWRIGSARRVREAIRLTDARATNLVELVEGQVDSDPPSAFGTFEFMTPVAELEVDRVTQAEASAYAHWRNAYQHDWNWGFDPIAIRFDVDQKHLEADVTVIPLTVRSRYREWVQLSAGETLAPDAGDSHGALIHGILAINRRGGFFAEWVRYPQRGVDVDVVGWLGPSVAVYADDGVFWQESSSGRRGLEALAAPESMRPPIVLRADVASRLRLDNLLRALQEYIEGEWPRATEWETRFHRGQSYVKVSPTSRVEQSHVPLPITLYYATPGDVLLVAVQEEVLLKAIDRELDRQAEVKNPFAPVEAQWLGGNIGLHVNRKVLEAAAFPWQSDFQVWMQTQAWNNLPILNDWKRRFPNQDPISMYQNYWNARLECPGGGKYVWNGQWQTYESTVYGHPGQPKLGPSLPPALAVFQTADFGLTFENDGVRARLVLEK